MESFQLIKFVDLYHWNKQIVIQESTKRFIQTIISPKKVYSMKIIKYVDLYAWIETFILQITKNFQYQVVLEMQKRGLPRVYCIFYLAVAKKD